MVDRSGRTYEEYRQLYWDARDRVTELEAERDEWIKDNVKLEATIEKMNDAVRRWDACEFNEQDCLDLLCEALNTCDKCNIPLVSGVAIEQTWVPGVEAQLDGELGGTYSPGGPGKLIAVWKCPQCGWSKK